MQSVNTMADNLQRSRHLERQFLLSVSHDLRTPLTSIRGYAEALTDGAVDDPSAVGAVIEGESKRLERPAGIPDWRAPASPSTSRSPSRDRRGHRPWIEPDADDRSIELSVRVPDMPTQVMVDPDRYAQIVSNLVGNALRFADDAAFWRAEGRVHLAVADDGPGITDADLPTCSNGSTSASTTREVRESGSGLGLAYRPGADRGHGRPVVARRSAGGAEFALRPAR